MIVGQVLFTAAVAARLLLFPSFPRNSSPTNEIHTGTNIPNTDSDQFHGKLATDKLLKTIIINLHVTFEKHYKCFRLSTLMYHIRVLFGL